MTDQGSCAQRGGTWNYRVLVDAGRTTFSIHEAYYDCDGTHDGEPCSRDHVPHSWSENSFESAEDLEELRFRLEAMLKALDRPILALGDDGKLEKA